MKERYQGRKRETGRKYNNREENRQTKVMKTDEKEEKVKNKVYRN